MKNFKYRYIRPYMLGVLVAFALLTIWSMMFWNWEHLTTFSGLLGITTGMVVLLDDLKDDYDRKAGK